MKRRMLIWKIPQLTLRVLINTIPLLVLAIIQIIAIISPKRIITRANRHLARNPHHLNLLTNQSNKLKPSKQPTSNPPTCTHPPTISKPPTTTSFPPTSNPPNATRSTKTTTNPEPLLVTVRVNTRSHKSMSWVIRFTRKR